MSALPMPQEPTRVVDVRGLLKAVRTYEIAVRIFDTEPTLEHAVLVAAAEENLRVVR